MTDLAALHPLVFTLSIWVVAYLLAVIGSGQMVRLLIYLAKIEPEPGNDRAGRVIGKIEDVLVVTFVAAGAYTALALIFAAKSIARVDHDSLSGPASTFLARWETSPGLYWWPLQRS